MDESKLNVFMDAVVHHNGAVMHAATVVVGDQLGLYKALADAPATAEALARRTGTDPRYLRARLRDVVQQGGVRRFGRAAETPFNLVFEARP